MSHWYLVIGAMVAIYALVWALTRTFSDGISPVVILLFAAGVGALWPLAVWVRVRRWYLIRQMRTVRTA